MIAAAYAFNGVCPIIKNIWTPTFVLFSGGAAFAGGLVLDDPGRFAGTAILYGTVPFDAGVPVTASRLDGRPVLVAQGDADTVIPRDLLDRTWAYLHDESGAVVTSRRDPGGHGISPDTAHALGKQHVECQLLPAGEVGALGDEQGEVVKTGVAVARQCTGLLDEHEELASARAEPDCSALAPE